MRFRTSFSLLVCALVAGLVAIDVRPSVAAPVAAPAAATTPTDACGPILLKDDGTPWECSFVDDFSGEEFDTTKWVAQDTRIAGITNGSSCFVPRPWNIRLADGKLRLSARKLRTEVLCKSPLGDFRTRLVSSTLTTRDRFSQAYGRFEVRARMPVTRLPGAHSAIWLFPNRQTYGVWPTSGEIDIAEWFSADPTHVYPSVHYGSNGGKNSNTGFDNVVSNVSAFHTYRVDWTPTTMKFYYDGNLAWQHSWTGLTSLVGSQPFDKPFNVILGQGWGQLWNAPVAGTPNNHLMVVDWVRVWK